MTPYTMALIAKYIARHRLREVQLLDTIADFLVKKADYLDSKVSVGAFSEPLPGTRRPQYDCSFCVSSGDPETGVPFQQDELPPVQRAAVLLPPRGSGGAESAQLATGYRQHPYVSFPAGSLSGPGTASRLLHGIYQQRHQ